MESGGGAEVEVRNCTWSLDIHDMAVSTPGMEAMRILARQLDKGRQVALLGEAQDASPDEGIAYMDAAALVIV